VGIFDEIPGLSGLAIAGAMHDDGGGLFGDREHHAIAGVEHVAARCRRIRKTGRVGQDDDICFETLRSMHRHHADFVALLLHVALHHCATALDPMQKSLQGRRIGCLIGQRQRKKLLDRVGGFAPRRAKLAVSSCLAHAAHGNS
jgi:hypothetical protein